ncbi:CU044_2847 family protein [Streptomyces avermitilis]|uniref:CU044_2847 family protein n=1 Tax=Streptomyces avermitilis TaxID=33903 RepID=UPI0036789772
MEHLTTEVHTRDGSGIRGWPGRTRLRSDPRWGRRRQRQRTGPGRGRGPDRPRGGGHLAGRPGGRTSAAEGALAQLRAIDPPPEEVEVSFGVAVDGKLGATLVSAGTNAHLNIKVVWRNTTGTTAPEPTS